MKLTLEPAPRCLHEYVSQLLEDWQPECLSCEYSHGGSSPPSLHDLFDLELENSRSPSPLLCDWCAEADSESTISTETDVGFTLNTPPVSPLPSYSTSPASIPEDMLLCLEEMPTFDDGDEVRSATTSFEHWENNFDPNVGSFFGCLRCAYYQEQGENSICGLCYLKALAEEPVDADAGEDDEVIFVSAKPGSRKRSAVTSRGSVESSKRPCLPEPEQTEPLDLSLKPRPQ
uniref:Early E1A protein n=1 Tax=Canine adenovirus serotype 1 (strain CLL) TaxID=69150 RepID=E1A_ADECC|nr:RecName: Full=Early E1A protein; AltName: Full=Early E1A 25 kDa protein [Canine adenovirus 1 strain CLL]AAB05429.1 E1A protein [Canine adenovirus 1]